MNRQGRQPGFDLERENLWRVLVTGNERWMGGSVEYCPNCEIKSEKLTPVLSVDMNQ